MPSLITVSIFSDGGGGGGRGHLISKLTVRRPTDSNYILGGSKQQ